MYSKEPLRGIISSDIMTLYSGGQSLLGKRVSSLVGNDLKVLADGSVVGTIKKVTGYTQFSSKKEEQSGYYFPFKLTKTGTTMTLKRMEWQEKGKKIWRLTRKLFCEFPEEIPLP